MMKYKQHLAVGILAFSLISSNGFIIGVTNIKNKTMSSAEIATDTRTIYSKNGISATAADLTVGQKVIVVGDLDETTNVLTAKKVKIVK